MGVELRAVSLGMAAGVGAALYYYFHRRRRGHDLIALIDLAAEDAPAQLDAAFRKHGFCVVLPSAEVVAAATQLRSAAYEFFAQPDAIKAQ